MITNRPSSWGWFICGLLLVATTVNCMDRRTLANAAVRVTKVLSLSQEQYGELELAFSSPEEGLL